MQKWLIVCVPCALLLFGGCAGHRATPEEAKAFIDDAEQKLLALSNDAQRADWIKDTYITDDTEAVAAIIDERAHNTYNQPVLHATTITECYIFFRPAVLRKGRAACYDLRVSVTFAGT